MSSPKSRGGKVRAQTANSRPGNGDQLSLRLLLALVFFSGFAALVYELLWFRKLGLVFGNTVQAAATVLAAFMAGLAWGAHWSRRWLARTANPLRLFGFIEAGIGLYALLVPAAFILLRLGYREAAHLVPDAPILLTALRFLLALLALLLPTTLMGASLPVLSEALLRSRDRFAGQLGMLYGCNTAGATFGVLACGFFLVEKCGVFTSNLIAAGVNLAVSCTVILFARRFRENPDQPATDPPRQEYSPRILALLGVAALCGGLALAFETVWFRALILVMGSTSYSFAIMVGCFLCGISLGSFIFGRLSDRPNLASWALAVALAGTGIWTLLSMQLYNTAPDYFLSLLARMRFTWTGMVLAKAAIGAIFLLPLAVLSGVAFTAVARLVREGMESAGRAVGAVFSFNAIGSAIGAAGAGFALLPALGLERSLFVLGCAATVCGVIVTCLAVTASWPRRLAFASLALISAGAIHLLASPWDPLLLCSGPYFAAWANVSNGKVSLRQRLETVELVLYREGKTSTVDVKRTSDGQIYFSSDGKVEADTSPQSMVLQRMMGHIPMLLHPKPRRVLNIGLGAGVTAGALTCYPGAEIEVVDIEPAVTEVAKFWAPSNHDLIRRGKFRLFTNDGRNHLLVTTNRYDVITADPFEPVVAGAASLYTVDHFELARSRLATNGVMAQFLPLYELSREDLMIILRSFLRVFPRSALFFTGCDTILLGMTGDAEINLKTVAANMAAPEAKASLTELGIERPERLLDMLVMDIQPGDQIVAEGAANTDNLPIIEFSAPKSALDYQPDANQRVLLDRFHDIPGTYLSGLTPEAALEVRRGHEGLRLLLRASILRSAGDMQGGVKLLQEAAEMAPSNPIVKNELSGSLTLLASTVGSEQEAIALYKEALRVNPLNFAAIYYLARLPDEPGKPSDSESYLSQGLAAYPEAALLLAIRGEKAGKAGDAASACRDFATVVRKLPHNGEFWERYAYYLERAGRHAESSAAAAQARKLVNRH